MTLDLTDILAKHRWRTEAACRGIDPAVFFPTSADAAGMKYALSICAACPVKAECLEANLWEPDGVWGGTSAKERTRIRVERDDKVRPCLRCGTPFMPENPSTRMCGEECRTAARRETRNKSKAKNQKAAAGK
jgi:WhiB family redox-sensing transcriptional regulator